MDQVAWQWNAQVRSSCVWWARAAKQAPGARREREGKREWAAKTSVDRNSLMEGRTPNEGNDIKREIRSEVN